MRRAIALAHRGEGRVEPNPMVGCVIARNDRILGEGYHRRFGGPHAEEDALRACRDDPRGATAYVSLEPCCHHGKTPPCAEALIQARIARVVVALRDPHPLVAGGGIRLLRNAGIAVEVGSCREEAAEVLAPFLTHVVLRRPYVIAKWAQSLDGKLATRTGDSKWLSNEASRRLVHKLRARVDAVMVGIGTVVRDDPLLTARNVPLRRRAARVVLDARLRIPPRAQLVRTAGAVPTLVLTTRAAMQTRNAHALERAGAELLACRAARGRISLEDALTKLARRGMTNVLVEGGPTVFTSLFASDLVDEAWVFTAPRLIGGVDAPGSITGRGSGALSSAIAPRNVRIRRIGDDVLHRFRLTDPPMGPE